MQTLRHLKTPMLCHDTVSFADIDLSRKFNIFKLYIQKVTKQVFIASAFLEDTIDKELKNLLLDNKVIELDPKTEALFGE